MLKTSLIISLVMLAVIAASISQGIIASAFSLLAFTLLFFVDNKGDKNNKY